MSDQPPTLRPPTWRERLTYRRTRRWPTSYVKARLAYCDHLEKWAETADPDAVLDAFISTPMSPENDRLMRMLDDRMREAE